MLPLCFPTTVLMVDDDVTLLESFSYRYSSNFRTLTTSSPEMALQMLTADEARLRNLTQPQHSMALEYHEVESESSEALVAIDTSWIRRLYESPERAETISLIIVDYAMPSMTGVDLCRKIQHLMCRKLMLTGRAGDDTAVSAFNESLIDGFLVKHDPQLPRRLPQEVHRLNELYFERLCSPLAPLASQGATRFLGDKSFTEALKSHEYWSNVNEHYLNLDPPGFVVASPSSDVSLVLVYDEETMRAQLEAAQEEAAPAELLANLQRFESCLHFPTPNGFYTRDYAQNWKDHVSPATAIAGRERWWVAVVKAERLGGRFPRTLSSVD
jgi:CheY-like chemotaxis protein